MMKIRYAATIAAVLLAGSMGVAIAATGDSGAGNAMTAPRAPERAANQNTASSNSLPPNTTMPYKAEHKGQLANPSADPATSGASGGGAR